MIQIAKLGWNPDRPDHRDLRYVLKQTPESLPPRVDERYMDAVIYDQGDIGSCTANMGCGLFNYELKHQGLDPKDLSRLALYYITRMIEGTAKSDAGATIRDTIKMMAQFGVPPEADWPYDTTKVLDPPPPAVTRDAGENRVLRYERLDNTDVGNLKDCLFSGFGFGFGFTVCRSFMSIGFDGLMPTPQPGEDVVGGHAVRAVGYDDGINGGSLIVANSWGAGWGDKGYFYMPYAVASNADMADDFWAVRLVTPDN